MSRKSNRGESREPASFFGEQRKEMTPGKKRESSEGKLFSLLLFPATEGGAREIKRAKSGRGRVRM